MLTKEQKDKIEDLYIEYQDSIKPLTFYVERKYHKFPKSLLKEFRDVFDHVSRCYESDATEEYKNDNIAKAKNHFDRIKLDTYKYVSDYKKREFIRWKRKYDKYDLQGINNGEFWKEILFLEEEGERIFSDARKVESKDIVKACNMIQDSTLVYDTIMNRISCNRDHIIHARFKYKRETIINKTIGFVVGIIASIFATYIWEMIKCYI